MIHILLILSVLFGALLVSLLKPKQPSVSLLLSFSGAYLLAITVLHLFPETYLEGFEHEVKTSRIGLFILIGILIQSILESFSKGAEHGHIHLHSDSKSFPWLLFFSLSIHAFSEGIPVGYSEGNQLLWAIIVHKIPISIVLATFLLSSKLPKKSAFTFIILFALMSPLGIILSKKVPLFFNHHLEITAITIGIFLHISTVILFESSKNHAFNFSKFLAIVLGMALAFIA